MQHHYSAQEAIQRLGLPRSTFYYLVRIGLIRKINLPLRKQAIYLKEQIDALALERDRILAGMAVQATTAMSFGTPTLDDLRQARQMKTKHPKQRYHYEPNRELEALHYNPQAIHVLRDEARDQVIGLIKMSPLRPHALAKLLDTLQTTPWEPEPEDYCTFEVQEQEPLSAYLFDFSVREKASPYVGVKLFREALFFLVSLMDQGVVVKYLYTTVGTEQGQCFAERLGFIPLDPPMHGLIPKKRSAIHYRLDLLDTKPRSQLVAAYLRSYRNMRRRVRRYTTYVQAHAQPSPTIQIEGLRSDTRPTTRLRED